MNKCERTVITSSSVSKMWNQANPAEYDPQSDDHSFN